MISSQPTTLAEPSARTSGLTIFAIPKAFRGHFELIQRNAITSWALLRPRPEIILFGDDPGTAEAAQELGVRHIPQVERNPAGAPMLHDLFAQAEDAAQSELLAYVNSDIILMDDFLPAVQRACQCGPRLMMIGRRWEIDLREACRFQSGWEMQLRERARTDGRLQSTAAVDYFVFSRGLGRGLLPLAIGRVAWDNWLVWHARSQKAAVVDATQVVTAIHQNHDYSHHPGGTQGVWRGEEAKRNRALIGDWYRLLDCSDATHILTAGGLKRSRRHGWMVVKRAWSHPWGVLKLGWRVLGRVFGK